MADNSTMTQRQQVGTGDNGIDFGYLFGILLDNKWLIIITAFVALMLGWGYGKWATPIYQGDVLLQQPATPAAASATPSNTAFPATPAA